MTTYHIKHRIDLLWHLVEGLPLKTSLRRHRCHCLESAPLRNPRWRHLRRERGCSRKARFLVDNLLFPGVSLEYVRRYSWTPYHVIPNHEASLVSRWDWSSRDRVWIVSHHSLNSRSCSLHTLMCSSCCTFDLHACSVINAGKEAYTDNALFIFFFGHWGNVEEPIAWEVYKATINKQKREKATFTCSLTDCTIGENGWDHAGIV